MNKQPPRTISFEQLQQLKPWNPATLESAAQMGGCGDGDGFMLCLIPEPLADEWNADSDALFIAKQPSKDGWITGVALTLHDGQWQSEPHFADSLRVSSWHQLSDVPVWLRVLYEVAQKNLGPLLYFSTNRQNTVHAGVAREAASRVAYFQEAGAQAFCDDAVDALAWEVASNWSDAKLNAEADERRCQTILDTLGVTVASSAVTELIPEKWLSASAQTKRKLRENVSLPVVDWSFLEPTKEKVTNRLEVVAHKDKFFTLGGSPSISLPFSAHVLRRFPKFEEQPTLDELEKRLWWWRSSEFLQWDKTLQSMFYDNWERSALCYEFRFRTHRKQRGEPFSKPWCRLNNSQRGVLVALWPVPTFGRSRIQRELPGPVAQFLAIETIKTMDPSKSSDEIPELVAEALMQLRANVPASERRNKAPKHVLSEKWRALELLDRSHFLEESLKDGEQALISKLRGDYKKGCTEAGIEP